MAENPTRFGIMGCANIARKVARAINLAPNSTLYAIASRSVEKAKQFVSSINGLSETVKIYGGYEQLLDDPLVDVVYMPLPTSLHVHWAVLAAQKKKHLLIEKPTALDAVELDQILEACEFNGVQFMDGSMWLHHPRTAKMKEMLLDSGLLGPINYIYSSSTFSAIPEFLANNIRVNPEMDALGALGDLGWYCIGAILWAKNYQLPTLVTALSDTIKNSTGVILSLTASLHYDQPEKTVATIHCSFLSHSSMDLGISGSKGSLHLNDFIIPYREDSAFFHFTVDAKLVDLHIGWNLKPERVVVSSQLAQEALMVQELARLVECIRKSGCRPDGKWPEISRKTQLVLDAVKKSVDLGFKPVNM
ncbi:GFO_IDH_MocA domain-containing protein [Cephalotus follicularis]|uniref:GFO_IDH_MocA domain-containing protein n=1 Tax=Cephalotus follicularis TaxID=3775 RepID=A0A1Q3AXI5_CEPFO|nr:GFO_IDH_MocA domain-containing protein [Cephalotus follicularis]